jgi:uncharacterized pyridoxal phosphate-containing UPF0001 family protein
MYLSENMDELIAKAKTLKQIKFHGLLRAPPLNTESNLQAKYTKQTFTAKATIFTAT